MQPVIIKNVTCEAMVVPVTVVRMIHEVMIG